MGFADAFMQGSKDAQDYAVHSANLELQRGQLEQQRAQLEATKDQHKIQTTMKLFEDWDEVAKIAPGPLQKAKLKKLQLGYAQLGIPWDSTLEAAVQDENGRAEFFKSVSMFRSLPDNIKGELAAKASGYLGSEKGYDLVKYMNTQADDFEKITKTAEEQRKTDANKVRLEKPAKEAQANLEKTKVGAEEMKTLRQTPEWKEYSALSASASSILDAVNKTTKGRPSPFRDVGLLYDFMKVLDPNSVVRESEQGLFISTGSAYTKIANTLTKLYNGQTISADQKKELADIAFQRLQRGAERYQASAESTLKSLEEQGIPRNRVDPGSTLIPKDLARIEAHAKRIAKEQETAAKTAASSRPTPDKIYQPSQIGAAKRFKAMGKTLQQVNDELAAKGKAPIPQDLADYVGLK